MPIITTSQTGTERIEGAEHGATISLILDHSDPGQGRRLENSEGARPSELAAKRGMSKQAANYLLGQLEALGYSVRDIERDWQAQLGRDRFAQLRALLLELNQPA